MGELLSSCLEKNFPEKSELKCIKVLLKAVKSIIKTNGNYSRNMSKLLCSFSFKIFLKSLIFAISSTMLVASYSFSKRSTIAL
jgi:hypothetical protein